MTVRVDAQAETWGERRGLTYRSRNYTDAGDIIEQLGNALLDSLDELAALAARLEAAETALREIAEGKVPTTYGGGLYAVRRRAIAYFAAGRGEHG